MRHSLNSRCFPCTREFTIPPLMSETFINDHKCIWVWVQPKESSQKVMRWPLLWAASFGVSWDHVQSPMRKNLLSFTLFAQSVTSSWLEKDPVSSTPVQVLNENQSLRILDLKKNDITEQGALVLAEAPCSLNLIKIKFLHGNEDLLSLLVI